MSTPAPGDKKAADPTKAKEKKDEKKENNEPEPLKEIDIPDNILTNEDKIVMNNHEIIVLKKDNKELRMKLKDLNERLTETLEKIRLRAVQASKTKEAIDPSIVHQKEMENADSQIELYNREIAFLMDRNKEGGQIDKIKTLTQECTTLIENEERMTTELKQLNTASKAIGNRMKKLSENKDHNAKMRAMTEEKSLAEKRIRFLREKEEKDKQMYEKQEEFMRKMEQRYNEACTSTNTPIGLKVDKKPGDEKYTVILLGKKEIKDDPTYVFTLDHPDKMLPPKTEDQFNQLKQKVMAVSKSLRTDEKSAKMKLKNDSTTEAAADKLIDKLQQTLMEEDRLYEQLVDRIEKIHKEVPQKRRLAPMNGDTKAPQENSRYGIVKESNNIIDQMKKIVEVKRLEEGGSVLIKGGLCDNEIQGDRQMLAENQKVKLIGITFWVHLNEIIAMQGVYSPTTHNTLKVGKDTVEESHKGKYGVQKILFDISKVPIKKLKCYYSTTQEKLYCVEFTLRNDKIEKFGMAPDEHEPNVQVSSVSVPPYEYVKSISFYGSPVPREVDLKASRQSGLAASRGPNSTVRVVDHYAFSGFALDILP